MIGRPQRSRPFPDTTLFRSLPPSLPTFIPSPLPPSLTFPSLPSSSPLSSLCTSLPPSCLLSSLLPPSLTGLPLCFCVNWTESRPPSVDHPGHPPWPGGSQPHLQHPCNAVCCKHCQPWHGRTTGEGSSSTTCVPVRWVCEDGRVEGLGRGIKFK